MAQQSSERSCSEDRVPVASLPERIGQRWIRQRRFGQIPDQPIIHFIRETTPDLLNEQLDAHLGTSVPHVRVSGHKQVAGDERSRSVSIRELLDRTAREFIDHDARKHLGRFRFERYALLSWLLKQNLVPAELGDGPNSQTREMLREYIGSRLRKDGGTAPEETTGSGQRSIDTVATRIGPLSPPWWATVLAYLAVWIFPWVRRVRGGPIGTAQRWFMHGQHYLAPRESADFASFAQRLLTTPSVHENAVEVRKLLVHAFLEDLAEGYARHPVRLNWIRRSYYPVLLLQGLAPDTLGEELVRLVNDVRNETASPDPLLIVATGSTALQEVPPTQDSPTLDEWPETLRAARRRRSPTAWYVPVWVSDVEDLAKVDHSANPTFGGVWAWRGRIAPPHFRPLLRWVPVLLLPVTALGAIGLFVDWQGDHCRSWWEWPWPQDDLVMKQSPDSHPSAECIGVASGNYRFSSEHHEHGPRQEKIINELNELQGQIIDNNAIAEPKPGHITVVYFGIFTKSDPDSDSPALAGAVEELKGVLQAQEDAIHRTQVPMRVVLANAGEHMKHAVPAAERIVKLAKHDDSVVGIAGLGQSKRTTYQAVDILDKAGLPMVGSTTSSVQLSRDSKLFYQVSPLNKREAAVVAHYARTRLGTDQLAVYYDSDDAYSDSLARKVKEEMPGAALIEYGPETGYPDPNSAAKRACKERKWVFFAGRSNDLAGFLQGNTSCPQPLTRVFASDDTIRFVLNDALHAFPDMTLDYISFANKAKGELKGRAVLAHDATALIREAAQRIVQAPTEIDLSPTVIWRGLAEINGAGSHGGLSGVIDFGHASKQIPVNKAITVQQLRKKNDPAPDEDPFEQQEQLLCGQLGDRQGDPDCPRDD